MSNLLPIPFRLTDTIPLKEELAQLIKKDYFQPASSFAEDLHRALFLQNQTSAFSKDKSPKLLEYEEILFEYFHLLGDIACKFPDAISFQWYGTLGYKPKHCVITTWRHEQMQVAYQLGALYSQRALQQSIHTDDGLKAACSFFKLAAGCFEYLLKNKIAGLSDFDLNTLLCLKWMMVGLAQELIWQKAITNTAMKDSVIARLSVQVSEYYEKAIEAATESDSIKLEWINQFQVKKSHFRAAAHYRMSVIAQDNFNYGEQVAHLGIACGLCDTALKYKRYVNAFVLEDLQGLSTTAKDTFRTAKKDNDLVYLKPVPDARDLAPIAGVSMVEPEIPANMINHSPFPTLFATLIPFSIIQVAQAFRERQDSFLVEHFHEPLQALNRMLSKFLAERDLPASIDTIQKPENLPDSIVKHSKEIISIGGTNIIQSSMVEIAKLANQCSDLVVACEERLKMEKYEDDLMREREGSARWTRAPSLSASSELSSRIKKMGSYLEQGHQSDILINDGYNSIKHLLEIYCGGHDSLTRHIPRSSHIKLDPAMGKIVADLRELLDEAHKLETNRQRFLSSLEIKSRDRNVLPLILSEFKQNPDRFQNAESALEAVQFEYIYERHIKLFNNDLKYVELLKELQVNIEKKIHSVNLSLTQARSLQYDVSQQNRLDALQTFEEAYVQYLELVSNLNNGSRFYSDFLEKGSIVLKDTDDFLYSRREEARELEIGIRNQNKLANIESSMARETELVAPKGQKPPKSQIWDSTKGIKFS